MSKNIEILKMWWLINSDLSREDAKESKLIPHFYFPILMETQIHQKLYLYKKVWIIN